MPYNMPPTYTMNHIHYYNVSALFITKLKHKFIHSTSEQTTIWNALCMCGIHIHSQLPHTCHQKLTINNIIVSLQPSRLRGWLDVCIDNVETATNTLDLHDGDINNNVQSECPISHCSPETSFTITGNDSFLQFAIPSVDTHYLKASLQLRTRYILTLQTG